ncbi:MAG: hypothetical protein K6G91_06485 [Kiritimatiellae bacterium]|nr:hypothetical protein [Kiritimatiellia bacterium]
MNLKFISPFPFIPSSSADPATDGAEGRDTSPPAPAHRFRAYYIKDGLGFREMNFCHIAHDALIPACTPCYNYGNGQPT